MLANASEMSIIGTSPRAIAARALATNSRDVAIARCPAGVRADERVGVVEEAVRLIERMQPEPIGIRERLQQLPV